METRAKIRSNKKLYLVYGHYEGVMFITKAPSPLAYSMRKEIKGKYNLKAKKDWQKRMQ